MSFGGSGVQIGQQGDGKKQIIETGLWAGNLNGTTGLDLFFFYQPLTVKLPGLLFPCESVGSKLLGWAEIRNGIEDATCSGVS